MFFLPFLMFMFLPALGEDYNILVMTSIREEAHNAAASGGAARVGVSGTTVTSAGMVLASSFAVAVAAGTRRAGARSARSAMASPRAS